MRTLRITLIALLGGIAYAQGPAPSPLTPDTRNPTPASIEGVVVKLGTNEPLANATVELRTDSGIPVGTTTERDGRFLMPNVAPGQYRLLATRSGYVRTEYSPEKSPAGSNLAVTSGQKLTGLRIVMTPAGVIAGRVTERGKPAWGIVVMALKVSYEAGQRVWSTVLSDVTDDLGDYHIFWLPPGRYYILANLTDALPSGEKLIVNPGGGDNPLITRGQANLLSMERGCLCGFFSMFAFSKSAPTLASDAEMHAPLFFPGIPDWQNATIINVTPGAEIHGVDIQGDTVPALHVRGAMIGAPAATPGVANVTAGQPGQPPRPQVALFSARPAAGQGYGDIQATTARAYAQVQVDPNGAFDIPRVQPGTYLLRATAGNMTATIPNVEVSDRDINGLNLVLAPSDLTVTGRVVVEGSAAGAPIPQMAVRMFMERADRFVTGLANGAADGSFTISNIPAGDYRFHVQPGLLLSHWFPEAQLQVNQRNRVTRGLENAYVKSIKLRDVDVLNDGLHLTGSLTAANQLLIVIGTDGGTVQGRILNSQQQPTAATVVLIPENGLRFHYFHDVVSTDASGKFQIKGIAPGDYKLFAWEEVEPGAWQNADFIRNYEAQGKPVHIGPGGATVPVDLTSMR